MRKLTRFTAAFSTIALFGLNFTGVASSVAAVSMKCSALTDDPSTGASLNPFLDFATGKEGWFKKSSPTLANIDADAQPEIVVGSMDGKVYAFNNDCSRVTGWPANLGSPIQGAPAIGNIDNSANGSLEIVVGTDDGNVYALNGNGGVMAGWPQGTGSNGANCSVEACTGVVGGVTLADLNGDGTLEVIAGSHSHKMWVWGNTGAVLPGWPRDLWDGIADNAAVGDLNRDGSPDIVIGSDFANNCADCPPFGARNKGGLLHAFDTQGNELPGWPISTDSFMDSSPTLVDLDSDGFYEVVVGGGNFDTETTTRGHHMTAYRSTGDIMWRIETPEAQTVGAAAIGDVNNDGTPEVAFTTFIAANGGGLPGGAVRLANKFGSVAWTQTTNPNPSGPSPNGGYVRGPVLGDIDGDGKADVVAADLNWHVKAWSSNGTVLMDTGLLAPASQSTWSYANSPAIGDVDSDGLNEVVTAGAAGDGTACGGCDTQSGHGKLWIYDVPGTGGLVDPQFDFAPVRVRTDPFVPPNGAHMSVIRNANWLIRYPITEGVAQTQFTYGAPTDKPVFGDWDNDGNDTPGVFRNGTWFLRNTFSNGNALPSFDYGTAGDSPVAGYWGFNASKQETIGIFRGGQWHERDSNSTGVASRPHFDFGTAEDKPVVGDWNGDGIDSPGVFRPRTGEWALLEAIRTFPNCFGASARWTRGDSPGCGSSKLTGTRTLLSRSGTSTSSAATSGLNMTRPCP